MWKSKSRHGGDIYGQNVKIDFSVNINPLGIPESVKEVLKNNIDCVEHYPDLECRALREALALRRKIPAQEILCGNGASELFELIVQALQPKKALVLAPSFSGYEKALRSVATEPEYFYLRKVEQFVLTEDVMRVLHSDLDMVFLCNPNNPVGNTINQALLEDIAVYCQTHAIYLVLDECFLELVRGGEMRSMVPALARNPYLIIVSAFTKVYAMPGLRLGYAMSSDPELLAKMKAVQAEWSVSVPAQLAGIKALQEDAYVRRAVALLDRERKYCTEMLVGMGFRVYNSETNFILFESERELYEPLLRKGILIRRCQNDVGLGSHFYRIAVKKHADNEILMEEIRKII